MSPAYTAQPSSSSIDLCHQQTPVVQGHFSVWRTFKHHIPRFLTTIIIDVILPLAVYLILQRQIRPVYALLAASSPPLLMVIFKAVWMCTFDPLGFLVFLTFSITALVAVITRSAMILLLEKSLMNGLLSVIFGVTLIPCCCCTCPFRWRPLAYYFYQDLVPTTRDDLGLPAQLFDENRVKSVDRYAQLEDELSRDNSSSKQETAQVYAWLYENCSSFRTSCRLITGIWSVGFMAEFLARVTLILVCTSVNKVVLYGHAVLTFITVIMIVLSIICITIERRRTLAFIERWKEYRLNLEQTSQRRSSDSHTSVVIVTGDSSCVLSVNA